jgi:hypothetical protein
MTMLVTACKKTSHKISQLSGGDVLMENRQECK